MAFPPGFLDELRSRIVLGDLVGRRVRLARRGRQSQGLCPFHNEKTPSFYVFDDHFHCFGCGAHGDAIGFVMRADHLDFIEAVERLAGEAGIPVPAQTPQERERAQRQKTLLEALAAAAACYEAQLWSPAGTRAREYLARRGLDEATIRRFRLGWAGEDRQVLRRALGPEFPEALLVEAGLLRLPDDGGAYDYFRGRVLYGWAAARAHLAQQSDGAALIVAEGYMDVIALSRAGFGGAVAPLGTALTEMQLNELWRLAPEPVLCFDGDTAGQRAALRALDRALPLLAPGKSLRFAVLPAGEDPDSLIRAGGQRGFAEVLASAWSLADMLWESEVRGRPRKTPEQLAAIQTRLLARVQQIPDRTLRIEYETLFRKRCDPWQSLRRARAGSRSKMVVYEAPPPVPPSPGRRNREVFLGIFVRYPALIEEWVEEIAAVDIPEPALDSLRRAILEIPESHPGLDATALEQHLASCGHAEILGALANAIARHAGFARGGDDPEVIRLGLTETLQLLRARGPSDREEAARALAAEASDENWRRLKALKDREAQDGPVGGFC